MSYDHFAERGDVHRTNWSSGNDYTPSGNCNESGSTFNSGRTEFTGAYAHSSLQPVATYVPRPGLEHEIEAQLPFSDHYRDLDQPRTVVVWGLGGSGKSQLVLNYIRKHRQKYRAVFWVEAGQKQSTERDYIQILKQLFPVAPSDGARIPIDDAVTRVKSWFDKQKGRLLWVMDSADTVDDEEDPSYIDLEHYLPHSACVDRIITTRSSRLHAMSSGKSVNVSEMDVEEAVQLFKRRARLQKKEDTEQEVVAIVKELGCLALAVTLAGSYVAESMAMSENIALYLPQFRAYRMRLLNQKAVQNVHSYHRSVQDTWEMSFAAVTSRSPVAARLLNLLAFINFDDIFLTMFGLDPMPLVIVEQSRTRESIWWREELSPNEEPVDHYILQSAFATLQAFSLLSWRDGKGAYAMHKLVHAWGRDRLSVPEQQVWSLAALEMVSHATEDLKYDLSMRTRMVPHVVANFKAVSAFGEPIVWTEPVTLELLSEQSVFLHGAGHWHDAYEIRSFQKRNTEFSLGKDHPDSISSGIYLAEILIDTGRYEQARVLQQETLELSQKINGKQDLKTLQCMTNLAVVLRRLGKFEQAKDLSYQTFELARAELGESHYYTLGCMNDLAMSFSELGEYEQAKDLFQKTLDSANVVFGEHNYFVLGCSSNLGSVLTDLGQDEEAEAVLLKTLDMSKKTLGEQHPRTLTCMNALAISLSKLGRHEQAGSMHQRTLELRERVLGQEHPAAIESMHNVAGALGDQGEYEKSERMYRNAFELYQKVLGREHPNTIDTIQNIGWTLRKQRKYDEAEEVYRRVLDLHEEVSGQYHSATLENLSNLARVLNEKGKYDLAEETYRRAVDVSQRVCGEEDTNTINMMYNTGLMLSKQGKHIEAKEVYERALDISERAQGDQHPDTVALKDILLEYATKQKQSKMRRRIQSHAMKIIRATGIIPNASPSSKRQR